ncbi:MAG: acireductone synthase [Verrucomicrobiae bacterium]|nr:acireductone synthase [Verrucomicrobiae bacterium]
MRALLTDIEGTTTSVSFVYDTLFPYFREHFESYAHRGDPALEDPLTEIIQTVRTETGQTLTRGEAIGQALAWAAADRKHTALKTLQGLVWRHAYESGEIKGHVYDDVPPALQRWKKSGLLLTVYSSGSVAAQQLLFRHSVAGDLTPFFSNYFDTTSGPKREPASYRHIAATLALPAADILFLSDVVEELDAAHDAGLQTLQLVRPGTPPGIRHRTAPDFSVIQP